MSHRGATAASAWSGVTLCSSLTWGGSDVGLTPDDAEGDGEEGDDEDADGEETEGTGEPPAGGALGAVSWTTAVAERGTATMPAATACGIQARPRRDEGAGGAVAGCTGGRRRLTGTRSRSDRAAPFGADRVESRPARVSQKSAAGSGTES